jgi:hypothetical protein
VAGLLNAIVAMDALGLASGVRPQAEEEEEEESAPEPEETPA